MTKPLFLSIVMLLGLASCNVAALQARYAGSDKLYPGSYRTRDQIAVLVQNEGQKIHLVEVDGKTIKKEYGLVFEFLPGRYTVGFELAFIKAYSKYESTEPQTLDFMAEPGHTYEFSEVLQANRWHPEIHDITDQLQKPDMEPLKKKIDSILANARSKQG